MLLYVGKLVSVKGTVVRVSDIKPYCTHLAFKCTSCGESQVFIIIRQSTPNN